MILITAAATTAETAMSFNPLHLFLEADIVVKLVIIGLLLASIWVWAMQDQPQDRTLRTRFLEIGRY